MFDRPKPTVGCSANGRRRRKEEEVLLVDFFQKDATCGARNAVLGFAPRKQADERGMAVEITKMYKSASVRLGE